MYCKYNPVVTSHLTFYVTFSPVVDSFDVNLMPRGQTNLPDVLTVRQQSGSTHREGSRDVSGVSGVNGRSLWPWVSVGVRGTCTTSRGLFTYLPTWSAPSEVWNGAVKVGNKPENVGVFFFILIASQDSGTCPVRSASFFALYFPHTSSIIWMKVMLSRQKKHISFRGKTMGRSSGNKHSTQ